MPIGALCTSCGWQKIRDDPICPGLTCRHGCEEAEQMVNFDDGEGEAASLPPVSSEEEHLFGSLPPTPQADGDSDVNSEDAGGIEANADASQLVLSVWQPPPELPADAPAEVTIGKRNQRDTTVCL